MRCCLIWPPAHVQCFDYNFIDDHHNKRRRRGVEQGLSTKRAQFMTWDIQFPDAVTDQLKCKCLLAQRKLELLMW